MRLNVKHKQALTKTDKQKKANEEKKSKGPKISKDYMNRTEYKHDNVQLDLTKLKYGIIESCDVDAVILPEGTIQLKGSWLELLIVMLDTLYNRDRDNFIQNLGLYEITNQFFCVDKIYGKYSFDTEQYKAYKIYDSGYYLETVLTSDNIFNALIGLCKSLGIRIDEFKIHLRNKKYKNLDINFSTLEEKEVIVSIDGVEENLKDGIHMVAIDILGVITRIHRLDVALVAICKWAYDNYGEDKLSAVGNYNNTGICKMNAVDDRDYTPISNSSLCVYSDNNRIDMINFIKLVMNKLDIGKDKIKFKFRALKVEKELKEWEVG
ncbi:MAG: hypothetical protein J6A59_01710 [Lachnospiraceae bacterium]|nr:hypothetical protein [Lachnospiraceae bacterium]